MLSGRAGFSAELTGILWNARRAQWNFQRKKQHRPKSLKNLPRELPREDDSKNTHFRGSHLQMGVLRGICFAGTCGNSGTLGNGSWESSRLSRETWVRLVLRLFSSFYGLTRTEERERENRVLLRALYNMNKRILMDSFENERQKLHQTRQFRIN